MQIIHHYSEDHNTKSAQEIVPYIFEILKCDVKSVIDVGCGLAQWLKIFEDYGVTEVTGVDGSHVPLDKINISLENFVACDLRVFNKNFVNKKFDLLLSLEVAEHLEEDYSHQFIQTLTELSDKIIFSAAIPNQTGENHFNEQYPNYWQKIFANYGYVFLDPFRERFWSNEKVNWWYRQNMFLVVREELADQFPYPYNGNFYIHPRLFEVQSKALNDLSRQTNSIKSILKLVTKKILERTKII